MKSILFIMLQLFAGWVYAQNAITFVDPLKAVANKRISSDIKSGSVFFITGVKSTINNGMTVISLSVKREDGNTDEIAIKKLEDLDFKDIDNISKVWDKHLLLDKTYVNMLTVGYQFEFRNEMNNDAQNYLNTMIVNDNIYSDAWFEDYLYTLTDKFHSRLLYDGRPGSIFIKVIKDPMPDAFSLTNGCIVLTTGLISTLQSEDELAGILVHQAAHFVCDHQLLNYNATIDREQRAEAWSRFATSMASGTDIFLSATHHRYISGIIPATAAAVSSAVSEDINNMLGTNFSLMQEGEADQIAKEILYLLGYEPYALSAALQRIHNYCVETGNYQAISAGGSHPNITSRINAMGQLYNIDSLRQQTFLTKVSYVNSFNAGLELWSYAHYLKADELAGRNIALGVPTESDYIVKAAVARRMSNTRESNEEALKLLKMAKSLSNTPSNIIFKEEGITCLRLNKKAEAKQAFESYLKGLMEMQGSNHLSQPDNYQKQLFDEISWTKDMILKVDDL